MWEKQANLILNTHWWTCMRVRAGQCSNRRNCALATAPSECVARVLDTDDDAYFLGSDCACWSAALNDSNKAKANYGNKQALS